MSERESMTGPNILCPEIVRPGQTGCKYIDLSEKVASIESTISGKDGIRDKMNEVSITLAEMQAVEGERATEADRRYKRTTLLLACLTLAVTICAAMLTNHGIQTGEVKLPKIRISNDADPTYNVRTSKSPKLSLDDLGDSDDAHPNDSVE